MIATGEIFYDLSDFDFIINTAYHLENGSGQLFRARGFAATAVPEPGVISLLIGCLATVGITLLRRRRKK